MSTYITPREAALRLRVTTGAVRAWIRAGVLPAVRLAGPRGRYRIAEDDLVLALRPVRNETEQEPRR